MTATADAWSAFAPHWERKIGDDGDELRRLVLRPLFEEWIAPSPAGPIAIDAGCGNGYLLRWLRAQGYTALGLDASAGMVSYAKTRADAVYCADLTDLDSDAHHDRPAADLVICSMVLDGIESLDGAIRGCAALLRVGGSIVVTVPHPCFVLQLVTLPGESGVPYQVQLNSTWKFPALDAELPYFRRPLFTYINALVKGGFAIDAVAEPVPPREYLTYLHDRSRRVFDAEDRERRKDIELPSYVLGILAHRT